MWCHTSPRGAGAGPRRIAGCLMNARGLRYARRFGRGSESATDGASVGFASRGGTVVATVAAGVAATGAAGEFAPGADGASPRSHAGSTPRWTAIFPAVW